MIYLIDKTNRLQWYNSEKQREEKKKRKNRRHAENTTFADKIFLGITEYEKSRTFICPHLLHLECTGTDRTRGY